MRNDTHRWPKPITQTQAALIGTGLEICVCETPLQTLISGNVEAAIKAAKTTKAHGWPDIVDYESHALRLRRDRILVVNGLKVELGWREAEGLAITDASASFDIIEMRGSNAMDVLQSGAEIDLRQPSASVMRRWHGINCMVVAIGEEKYRLHVPRSYLSYVWDMLETQVHMMSAGDG